MHVAYMEEGRNNNDLGSQWVQMIQPEMKLPVIDMACKRSDVSRLIAIACEQYGFFKVINHGVPVSISSQMEKESLGFFAKPNNEKLLAASANPFGYGSKAIGLNGDVGEVEYLLLNSQPAFVSQLSHTISNDPPTFSSVTINYIEAVTELACEILELMAEGLGLTDKSVFSRMVRQDDCDSLLRLNHYPSIFQSQPPHGDVSPSPLPSHCFQSDYCKVGFGEHSDPQMLTLLRSNDVTGLQISLREGSWVSVVPDPTAFYVNVGDLLQAMTNGKFTSVRHRAIVVAPHKSRMTIAFFAAPSLDALIIPPPEMVSTSISLAYRPFTWAEYKRTAFSRRLGDTRLDLFKRSQRQEPADHRVSQV